MQKLTRINRASCQTASKLIPVVRQFYLDVHSNFSDSTLLDKLVLDLDKVGFNVSEESLVSGKRQFRCSIDCFTFHLSQHRTSHFNSWFRSKIQPLCQVKKIELTLPEIASSNTRINDPDQLFHIHYSESGSASAVIESEDEAEIRIHEIVLPCGTSNYKHLSPLQNLFHHSKSTNSVPKCPGVYSLSTRQEQQVYLRTFPTDTFTLILHVPDIHQFQGYLKSLGVLAELMGGRAGESPDQRISSRGQLHLTGSQLGGLDIRFTDSPVVTSYFNEAPESILKDALLEVQSARIFGGDGTVQETKYGFAGDCWVEARAMMKSAAYTRSASFTSYLSSALVPSKRESVNTQRTELKPPSLHE